jgi:hypothetical protein
MVFGLYYVISSPGYILHLRIYQEAHPFGHSLSMTLAEPVILDFMI